MGLFKKNGTWFLRLLLVDDNVNTNIPDSVSFEDAKQICSTLLGIGVLMEKAGVMDLLRLMSNMN